jgi:exopolysaccharide biosynthesis polyprenyl glycosylphosphotransferase
VKSIVEREPWVPDRAAERAYVGPRRLLLVGDLVSACISLSVMFVILQKNNTGTTQTGVTLLLGGLSVLVTMGMQLTSGQYTRRARLAALSSVGTLLRDLVIGTAVATLLNYLTKGFFTGIATPSRLAEGMLLESFFLLGVSVRMGASVYQRWQFMRGRTVRKILVLGTGRAAHDFLGFVHNRPWLGVIVAGRLTCCSEGDEAVQDSALCAASPADSTDALLPVTAIPPGLEGLERLDEALRSSGASEVVVALDTEDQDKLPMVTRLLDLGHVPFKVIPSLFAQTYRATELLGYAEIPVIDVNVDAMDSVNRFWKRAMDLVVAAGALALLLPLELLIVAAIAAESGFPVTYKQYRVGKNGRRFTMYKFRTMVKDADARLEGLKAQNEADGAGRMFKMRSDPRVTRVGALLRKFSLDELPQLVNVLRNDMSMVGPRPPLPGEVVNYDEQHLYRLKAIPGVTGLWQISGRSDLDFEDMVRLDRYYVDNWSLGLDVSILLRTVWVVVNRRGAC